MDAQSQADPKFESTFLYSRITAKAVRASLIEEKGYREGQLPCRQTIGDILNRLGYRLKKYKKSNPGKRFLKPMPFSRMYFKPIKTQTKP